MEAMHSKMFDPPTMSPPTPDRMDATSPVPEVMAAAGYLRRLPDEPHLREFDLMHGDKLVTWDGRDMEFFLFRDPDGINAAKDGTFPGPTNRLPRGTIFHGHTHGHGPPPHTIHWHGQEPTTMNDGVGHCSFEIGDYTYQWQPNFIGSYFYHCHRNTVQHFEFGLYGFTIIDPPDAFFASILVENGDGTVALNSVPIGNGRPEPGFPLGRRRTAAYLDPAINPAFAVYGQDNFNPLDTPDPEANNANLPARLKFATDPHACTVAYDVEALWVVDDRDINWSNLGDNARATYPKSGDIPGVNDNFHGNWGGGVGDDDFFAFNDFRSTHFYVTGVPVPDDSGTFRIPGTGEIPHGIVVPPELMSGVAGVQVSINAPLNKTILLRALNAAYNNIRVTFPVDVVIIAWDGRALGVPPFGRYNQPVLVPAGTPVEWSVARRIDAVMRSSVAVNSYATVEFIDTLRRDVRFTARIPIHIGVAVQDGQTFALSGEVEDALGAPMEGVTIELHADGLGGQPTRTGLTGANGLYNFSGVLAGMYTVIPSKAGHSFTPALRHVTIANQNLVNIDFQANVLPAPMYTITGRIKQPNGQGVAGVTVTLSGTAPAQTTTDANGAYSFAGLANGLYNLTPTLPGTVFSPATLPVNVVDADVVVAEIGVVPPAEPEPDPENAFTISGTVTVWGRPADRVPMAGVTVDLVDWPARAVVATAVTDAQGQFSFPGLALDAWYQCVPSLDGYRVWRSRWIRMTAKARPKSGPNVTVPLWVQPLRR
jgi:hypothetical protein